MRQLAIAFAYAVAVLLLTITADSVSEWLGVTVFAIGCGAGFGFLLWRFRRRRARMPNPWGLMASVALALLTAFCLLGALGGLLTGVGLLPEPSQGPSPVADSSSASPLETTTPSPGESESPESGPSVVATPSRTPRPTPPTSASLDDAAGDVVDEEGAPADVPAYADIAVVSVESDDGEWLFTVRAQADLRWRDPLNEVLWYGFMLDTDRDGLPDYQVSLENGDDPGEWYGALFDWEDAYTYTDGEFPGVAAPVGSEARIRIEADAIGNPGVVWAAGEVERTLWPDRINQPFTAETTTDAAPDHQFPADDPDWIVVRR